MRNNIFYKSVVILLVGGFLTKLISMLIKIVLARLIGPEGMGIYMLMSPTFMLFMAIAQLGFPVAISKLVSEERYNNKNLVFSVMPISLIINIFIIIFLIISSNYISTNLLHEPRCNFALICVGLVLPFISISSILRGYFFGKQKMIPHVVSNVIEDLVRLIAIIIGIPIFLNYGIEYAVAFVVIVNILSEFTSILVLFFFLPKNFSITKKDIIINKKNIIKILEIGIPTTLSRLIGTIGYCFEPIILTFALLKCGYSNNYIITEYGVLNGFVMPLLLIPSFFSTAISQALIPNISKSYSNRNYKSTKSKLKQAIILSLIIGTFSTIIFELIPSTLMSFLYNTDKGINYVKFLAPVFLLHYIQSPLTSALQAMGKAKEAMFGTLGGTIIRTISLFVFCFLLNGMWGLLIATSLNILYVTIHQYIHVKKSLK